MSKLRVVLVLCVVWWNRRNVCLVALFLLLSFDFVLCMWKMRNVPLVARYYRCFFLNFVSCKCNKEKGGMLIL